MCKFDHDTGIAVKLRNTGMKHLKNNHEFLVFVLCTHKTKKSANFSQSSKNRFKPGFRVCLCLFRSKKGKSILSFPKTKRPIRRRKPKDW